MYATSRFSLSVYLSNSNSFGVFSHSKGFGAELFSGRFFGVFPYIHLRVSRGLLGKRLLLQKRFCGGFPQLISIYILSPKWLLLHKISTIQIQSTENGPIMSLLLWYSLGLFKKPIGICCFFICFFEGLGGNNLNPTGAWNSMWTGWFGRLGVGLLFYSHAENLTDGQNRSEKNRSAWCFFGRER